jgi:hypothetical protein
MQSHDPRTTPSGRKVTSQEERKKNAVNSGHYVRTAALLQCIRAAHAQRSDQNSGHLSGSAGARTSFCPIEAIF